MARILVIGATGYIGGRLVPRLLDRGHTVHILVRDPRKAVGRDWGAEVHVVEGDVLEAESIQRAFENIDSVFYLVHSMGSGEKFAGLDRQAATNCVEAARAAGVKRIIYLGGLGSKKAVQSSHLQSRHEVGDILRAGDLPVTEFRAAVIVGSGSVSFELIHHLVNRLPVMICPRWVYTRTQPIAVRDVLRYLVDCLDLPATAGQVIDIGGPDVMTYRDMMLEVASVLGLKRLLVPVPVLTPRLSSYWVNLVTPIPTQLARPLIDGLRQETVCENSMARELFEFSPMRFHDAVERALAKVTSHEVETAWIDSGGSMAGPQVDPSHLHVDRRQAEIEAPPEIAFSIISSLGGQTGWLYADWLWKVRGFIDKQLGGVGLRRGRRHPSWLAVGDALDFWRVEDYVSHRKLVLRAEMKVWGQAWLEFLVESRATGGCRITQTARYYPKGLFGLFYWYSVYPIHALVFRGMLASIGKAANESFAGGKKE
jgi:uncharacterized protein YbjT (DUF2867 family)